MLLVNNLSNGNPAIVFGGTAQAGNVFVYGSVTTMGTSVLAGVQATTLDISNRLAIGLGATLQVNGNLLMGGVGAGNLAVLAPSTTTLWNTTLLAGTTLTARSVTIDTALALTGGSLKVGTAFTALASGAISLAGTTTISNTASITAAATFAGSVSFLAGNVPSFLGGLSATKITATGTESAFPALKVNGNPSIPVASQTDLQNLPGFVSQFNSGTTTKIGKTGTVDAIGSEYLAAFVLKSNVGSTSSIDTANKIALYAETHVLDGTVFNQGTTTHVSGSGPAWSLNTLLYLDANLTTLTTNSLPGVGKTWAATGYELDVRNQSSYNFGISGVAGVVSGLNISAGGISSVNAAVIINGVDTSSIRSELFVNGIVFNGGAVLASSITDYTDATWANYIGGRKYFAVDVTSATFKENGSAIRLGSFASAVYWLPSTAYAVGDLRANGPNIYIVTTAGTSAPAPSNGPTGTLTGITDGPSLVWNYVRAVSMQRISAYDPKQNFDVQLIAFDNPGTLSTSSLLSIGSTYLGSIQVANSIVPKAGGLGIGTSSANFQNLWVTNINGTLYTPSSPSLKSDISELPPMLPVVMSIAPRSYKWRPGRVEMVSVAASVMVQEYEEITETETIIEVRHGTPTRVQQITTRQVPIFDDLPVVEEDGQPAVYSRPGEPALYAEDGSVQREETAPFTRQVTYRTPRMTAKETVVSEPTTRPDPRTHIGFLAPDFKAAFDAIGVDYGGYSLDADGIEALRPDQQIAILWKAVQELAVRLDAVQKAVQS